MGFFWGGGADFILWARGFFEYGLKSAKTPQDRKTIFETLALPVAKILSRVARQAPTKFRTPHLGHTPSTAGTFRKKFRNNSGKTPETLSERFLEFPSRVRLGCPKPNNSRHSRLPEHFQTSLLPPSTAGGRLFFQKWFRRGPLRAGHGISGSSEGISDHQK